MDRSQRKQAMVRGAFLGDALALGPHWLYETKVLDSLFPKIDGLKAPYKNSFHKNKEKGDFTHYGDQMLLFLSFCHDHPAFDIMALKDQWVSYMSDYDGYMDHATKASLEKFDKEKSFLGSRSDEISAISRMFPFLYYYDTSAYLRGIIEEQLRLTHNNDYLAKMSHYLVDLTLRVLEGEKPSEVIDDLNGYGPTVRDLVQKARGKMKLSPRDAISEFGQACPSTQAFPGVIYLLLKFEEEPEKALIENIKAGGDSAARGMILGGILGAYQPEQLNMNWYHDIKASEEIDRLLK